MQERVDVVAASGRRWYDCPEGAATASAIRAGALEAVRLIGEDRNAAIRILSSWDSAIDITQMSKAAEQSVRWAILDAQRALERENEDDALAYIHAALGMLPPEAGCDLRCDKDTEI